MLFTSYYMRYKKSINLYDLFRKNVITKLYSYMPKTLVNES